MFVLLTDAALQRIDREESRHLNGRVTVMPSLKAAIRDERSAISRRALITEKRKCKRVGSNFVIRRVEIVVE